jgi:uncharacterized protein involved in exopolysaccharide biosynthesis
MDATNQASFLTERSGLTGADLLEFLRLRLWIILGTAVVTVAIAAFLVFYLLSPTYGASTSLMLDPSEIRTTVETTPTSDFEKVVDFQSQIDIIKSSVIAGQVVDELGLANNRALSRIDELMIEVRLIRNQLGEIFNIKSWKKKRDPRAEAVDAIVKHLDVQAKPQSVVLKLAYTARSPEEAANTVNAVVRRYRIYFNNRLRERAGGVVSYLETQRDDVSHKLSDVEAALTAFRESDRMPLDSTPGASGLVGIVDSQKTQDDLKGYVLLMEEELRKMQAQYAPTYPPMVALKAKLAQYVQAINLLPQRDAELVRLQRNWELAQDGYKYLEQNLEKARLTEESNAASVGMVAVLEPAIADDEAIAPKPKLIMPLAVVAGLFLGFVLASGVHYLDQRVHSARDVTQRLGLRVLGALA